MGAGGAPDAGLVDGLRAGSRDAFEQLYELYRARIYNLALRIVQSPEDARDITQDVFVKVYRRLPGSRLTDLQLKPWLYRVAVNACYDHLRTRKVHRDIDVVSDTRAMPVDTFEQAEMSQLVEQTLGDLSERHRTVLVLKDIHGLRHDEIAGILGISRGATETLLFRARESFRTHYIDLTAELPAPVVHVRARRRRDRRRRRAQRRRAAARHGARRPLPRLPRDRQDVERRGRRTRPVPPRRPRAGRAAGRVPVRGGRERRDRRRRRRGAEPGRAMAGRAPARVQARPEDRRRPDPPASPRAEPA